MRLQNHDILINNYLISCVINIIFSIFFYFILKTITKLMNKLNFIIIIIIIFLCYKKKIFFQINILFNTKLKTYIIIIIIIETLKEKFVFFFIDKYQVYIIISHSISSKIHWFIIILLLKAIKLKILLLFCWEKIYNSKFYYYYYYNFSINFRFLFLFYFFS